jgi:dihydroorotate dehydrogenase
MPDDSALKLKSTIEGLTEAVRAAVRVGGVETVAKDLRISTENLELLRRGDWAPLIQDTSLVPRLLAWWDTSYAKLFREEDFRDLPFDPRRDFWTNFYEGPPDEDERFPPWIRQPSRPMRLNDFVLNFPFGVPACALTPNASYIEYFSMRGFDLLTYKTVRDRPWNPHPYPQWAFANVNGTRSLTEKTTDKPVVASLTLPNEPMDGLSLVNSFGVPSLPVTEWQEDVERSRGVLRSGQVLIVSVMGSPEEAKSTKELSAQFVTAAAKARDAGADILELNFSCPNSNGGNSLICQLPEVAQAIVSAVAAELKGSGTPLFIKISYLPSPALRGLMSSCAGDIQGVVAINTVLVPVTDGQGNDFFPGRPKAGLSGPAIKKMGLHTVKQLASYREDPKLRYEYSIVGVGGIMRPDDFDEYLDAGADAAQSCSGAWLNPLLAADIRSREYNHRSERALETALDKLESDTNRALLSRDDVPAYLKARLSRSPTRR